MIDGALIGEYLLLVEVTMRDEPNVWLRCRNIRFSDTTKVTRLLVYLDSPTVAVEVDVRSTARWLQMMMAFVDPLKIIHYLRFLVIICSVYYTNITLVPSMRPAILVKNTWTRKGL